MLSHGWCLVTFDKCGHQHTGRVGTFVLCTEREVLLKSSIQLCTAPVDYGCYHDKCFHKRNRRVGAVVRCTENKVDVVIFIQFKFLAGCLSRFWRMAV